MKNIKNAENLRKASWILLVIGGINRGLRGLFNFDIIRLIFGYGFFARIIYVLVGLATVYILMNPEKKTLHMPLRK